MPQRASAASVSGEEQPWRNENQSCAPLVIRDIKMPATSELEEMVLFAIGQLFRIECAVDRLRHDVLDLQIRQTPGGLEALLRDESHTRRAHLARSTTCHEYEELIESVESPTLEALLMKYQEDWCEVDTRPSTKARRGAR